MLQITEQTGMAVKNVSSQNCQKSLALSSCKHVCKVGCDIKPGRDQRLFWLGHEPKWCLIFPKFEAYIELMFGKKKKRKRCGELWKGASLVAYEKSIFRCLWKVNISYEKSAMCFKQVKGCIYGEKHLRIRCTLRQ